MAASFGTANRSAHGWCLASPHNWRGAPKASVWRLNPSLEKVWEWELSSNISEYVRGIDVQGDYVFVYGQLSTGLIKVLRLSTASGEAQWSRELGFSAPIGNLDNKIAGTPAGRCVAVGGGKMVAITAAGEEDWSVPETYRGVDIDSLGNAYVVDAYDVHKYSTSGVLQWSFPDTGTQHSFRHVHVAPSGNIWARFTANIRIVDPSGNEIGSAWAMPGVFGLCVDSSGNGYSAGPRSAEPKNAWKYDNTNSLAWGAYTGAEYAYSVAVDGSGNVYVASGEPSPGGATLFKYASSGALVAAARPGGNALVCVRCDSAGNVYCCGLPAA